MYSTYRLYPIYANVYYEQPPSLAFRAVVTVVYCNIMCHLYFFIQEKSRPPLRRNSSASKDSPSRPSHCLNRASSSGGSSIPSDSESRGSGQTPVTSTSDDSDGERTGNPPNDDKDGKRKTEKPKSLSPSEVYSADMTDKGSGSSSLPRVNKTALLRARNSREAIKTSARRSSPLRSRITSKPRHRRSTPSKDSKSTDPSSLRICSPSGKSATKSSSQENSSISAESGVSSSVSSSSMGDGAQAAVDAIFQAGTPESYSLPEDLRMNRNDSNNRTFVLG